MKSFRIFFLLWGIIALIGGFTSSTHQLAVAGVCFICVAVSLIQERIDKQWEKSNRR